MKNYFTDKLNIVLSFIQLESNHNDHTATHHADTHLMLNNPDNLLTTRSSQSIHKNITRSDRNLTLMIIFMTFLSILEHFLLIILWQFLLLIL